MTSSLRALLSRQMSLSTLNKSFVAAMRAAPARKRPFMQVVRPMATSSAGFEGDGRKVVIFTGKERLRNITFIIRNSYAYYAAK
jgi:hypothetical protein